MPKGADARTTPVTKICFYWPFLPVAVSRRS